MLFNIAVNMSDFEIKGKRLIEVFPTVSGGCILKFTSEPLPFQTTTCKNTKNSRLLNDKSKNCLYIFCFQNFETLIRIIEKLYTNSKTKKYTSSLYKKSNKFFLKIFLPICDIKTGMLISEFSEYSAKGPLMDSVLSEYGELLIEDSAIITLGDFFVKNTKIIVS